MARLNDPPIPVESIDALKRRFIRQNREIARVNSTQSLRIRNLETEVSRLLAENIALREAAISSAQEAERWKNAHQLDREVLSMKGRLEAKLLEVGNLVQELGGLSEKVARRRTSTKRKSVVVTVKSLDEREWKTRQTIGGVIAGERELQDGRLPPIDEDRMYPTELARRKSLLNDYETNQTSESPDLGPPPVAHFEVPDPVSFDATQSPRRISSGDVENLDEVKSLPSTLESRRKRRTSSLLQDMSAAPQPHIGDTEESQTALPKSGAKRKLDVSELDPTESTEPTQKDDFVFQRRAVSTPAIRKGSRFTPATSRPAVTEYSTLPASPQKDIQPSRKILAAKSTNSPTKKRVIATEKPPNDAMDGTREPISASTRPVTDHRPHKENRQGNRVMLPKMEIEDSDPRLPPKTPAGLDEIMSPFSTAPSVKNNTHVQEAAVLNSVEDVLNGSIGRASRRAKAAVSYAEPNLRDKMRRPGKELVGAIEGIDRSRESSAKASTHPHHQRSSSQELDAGLPLLEEVVTVKREDDRDVEKWKILPVVSKKDEPTSPLRGKEKRTESSHSQAKTNFKAERSTKAENQNHDLDNAVDKLGIFDPPISSSPAEAAGSSARTAHTNEQDDRHHRRRTTTSATSTNTNTSRRHSLAPSTFVSNSSALKSQAQPLASTTSTTSATTTVPARPASAASVRSNDDSHKPRSRHPGNEQDPRRSNSVATISSKTTNPITKNENGPTTAVDDAVGSAVTAALAARGERAASRRRSMVV